MKKAISLFILAFALSASAQSNYAIRLDTSCVLPWSGSSDTNWTGVGATGSVAAATLIPAGGYDFTGTNSGAQVNNNTNTFALLSGASHLAVSCWVRPDALSSSADIFYILETNTASFAMFRLVVTNANGSFRAGFRANTNDTFGAVSVPSGSLTNGAWSHLFAQVQYGGVSHAIIGINGMVVASNNMTFVASTNGMVLQPSTASPRLYIGRDQTTASGRWDGRINDVRVFTSDVRSVIGTIYSQGQSPDGGCTGETIPSPFFIRFIR